MPSSPSSTAAQAVPSSGAPTQGEPPPFLPTQEVRIAVVLYGGVALAIYINGVVQELLSLVRASAPARPTELQPQQAALAEHELVGTEGVYRKLAQMLHWSRPPLQHEPDEDDPVQTRFVVDILSGSSAGGINGIFLAKALSNEQQIGQLKKLWVDEGDIAKLVNDRRSYDGLDLAPQRPPRSLLNSRRFYWRMLSALDGMDEQAAPQSRFVDELDLWITATDVRGLLLPVDLYDRVVYERRHRQTFHFRYGTEYARGARANDFTGETNPFLAFAARCTAAFPFALEPMTLEDVDEVVGTETFRRRYRSGHAKAAAWRRFFDDYVRARRAADDPAGGDDRYYRLEAFSDGGILDNKPFTHATKTISRRRADLPVDRRLFYVEPDPGLQPLVREPGAAGAPLEPPAWTPPVERPDPLETVRAALLGLPRSEPIRDDLLALIERNREIARVREIATLVDKTVDEFPESVFEPVPLEAWRNQTLATMMQDRQRGLQYLAYHRLKIATVLDDLAELVVNLSGYSSDSDEYSGARCFVQAWFERHFPEGEPRPQQWTQNEFLLRYDVRYRLRRLNFLDARIEELLRFDERALRLWARFLTDASPGYLADLAPPMSETLRSAKAALSNIFIGIRAGARRLRAREAGNPLLEPLAALGISRAELLALLDGAQSKEESVERAHALLEARQLDPALTALAEALAEALEPIFRSAREAVDDLFAPERTPERASEWERQAHEQALRPLEFFFRHYESYDAVVLPLSYSVVDEADRVEVVRISPQDAPSLIDESSPAEQRRKLAGSSLHHFGGFFERAWRKNDILWGRLDAAERIIDTLLLPGQVPAPVRAGLLKEAQLAIIAEEFATSEGEPLVALVAQSLLAAEPAAETSVSELVDRSDPEDVREALAATLEPEQIWNHLRTSYEVDRSIDRERLLATIGRSTEVTGRLLDGIAERYGTLRRPARWLVRIGRLGWSLVEAATPRTFVQLLLRYWLALLVLMSLLMIIGGAVFGAPATAKAGWVLLLLALGWRLAVWLTEDVIRRRTRWALISALAVVAAIAGLAITEIALHLDQDVAALVDKLPERIERFLRWLWPWDEGKKNALGT
jgi:patatin-related protein